LGLAGPAASPYPQLNSPLDSPHTLPSPGNALNKQDTKTGGSGESDPLKEMFCSASLPDIVVPQGGSFYVHVDHKCCGCRAASVEMYMGTKEAHTELIATAEMPHCCCNCARLCGFSWLCETVIPVFNSQKKRVGEFQLARDCSCLLCLPRIKVVVTGIPGAKVWTRCCSCFKCAKRIGNTNQPLIYTGLKCIKDKVCCCFNPFWSCYRSCFTNRTVVESCVSEKDSDVKSFEVINVFNFI
jgi:hypothetical protein